MGFCHHRSPFPRSLLHVLFASAVVATPASADRRLLDYLEGNPPQKLVQREYSEDEVGAIVPAWPNPHLSFLPAEARPDYDYWRAKAKFAGRARRDAALATAPAPELAAVVVTESEPNDSQGTANFIGGLGTADGEAREADVSGSLDPAIPVPIPPSAEDDGSIPLARNTGLVSGAAVRSSGTVGDGPFGSVGAGTGDFDFYRVGGVAAGQTILVDVDTPVPFGHLDSFVVIYDSAGNALVFNDDDGASYDSFLEFTVPAADDYFVSIGGYGSFSLSDPFDSSSGPGVGSEGTYDVTIGLDAGDLDFFSFELEAGDIVGATVSGAGTRLGLFAPNGELRIGSGQDVTFIHPGASPLPGGGNAALSYVIETPGTWAIRMSGDSGAYVLDLRLFTNPLRDGEEGEAQILFLDFDGAIVDPSRFGGPPGSRALSPLAAFLPGWGLTAADEDAVIDAVVAAVEESISADVRTLGSNGDFDASGRAGEFDIEVLNSRDHADPAGLPNVSRVVVGGTISELGIATIGIAESIDVGNFETLEIAVVLLDLLSAPAGNPNSLNSFPRAAGTTIVDVIGSGVGNIVSHEAGHYFGNWHTEQFMTVPNIMDQGGNLPNTVGVGPDGIFGTADDFDVDFGRDIFVPNEGFVGVEDTLNSIAFGLPTPIFTVEVGLDVKPGNDQNPINPSSSGVAQVAILGSESFDVDHVDMSTLAFGPLGAAPRSGPAQRRDTDRDGFEDLVLRVDIPGLGLSDTEEELCFTGQTLDGTNIAGCDALRAVPLACAFGSPAGGGGIFLPEGPVNGGFELGDFTGWQQLNSGSGSIVIDDGSFVPSGPGGPVTPFEGSFAAATFQSGPGRHTLFTDVTLASDLLEAKLRWADNLQNFAGVFQDPNQEWRVEVWDPSDNGVLDELFSTEPGDPPIQDWTEREADLTAWIGETIRLAFTQEDNLFFFNARLDGVEVLVRRRIDIDIDVKPGNPNNPVNPMSQGVTSVALLGSDVFDVADVDELTLAFGPGGAPPAHGICDPEQLAAHVRDVDGDDDDDLVVHFVTPGAGIAFGDVQACVTGATLDGDELRGCDVIQTTGGCGIGFELALLLPVLRWLRGRRRSGGF